MYKNLEEVSGYINDMLRINNIKSDAFYKGRIEAFFNEFIETECKNKPLNAINYYDVNMYLESVNISKAERVNIYNALKRFFDYTYAKGLTNDVISQVKKPIYNRKAKEILSDEDYEKLKEYIIDKNNKKDINDRLLLGLFLFTGLSRKYIANLKNCDFIFKEGVYKLAIWQDNEKEVELPIKAELQLIINDYMSNLDREDMLNKVVKMSENAVSTAISDLGKKIGIKKCSPTILSNTFISKAISKGNYIYEVSKLTLESVSTIEKHIVNKLDLYNLQTSILNSF